MANRKPTKTATKKSSTKTTKKATTRKRDVDGRFLSAAAVERKKKAAAKKRQQKKAEAEAALKAAERKAKAKEKRTAKKAVNVVSVQSESISAGSPALPVRKRLGRGLEAMLAPFVDVPKAATEVERVQGTPLIPALPRLDEEVVVASSVDGKPHPMEGHVSILVRNRSGNVVPLTGHRSSIKAFQDFRAAYIAGTAEGDKTEVRKRMADQRKAAAVYIRNHRKFVSQISFTGQQ